MRTKQGTSLAAVALLLIPLMGCNRGERTVVPGVMVNKDKATVTLKSGGSTMTGANDGGSVELPADWPDDVPVYPGARVTITTSNPQQQLLMAALETGDSIEQIATYYEKEFTSQGWEITNTLRSDKGGMVRGTKGDQKASATVGTDQNDKRSISLSVMERLKK